MFVINNRLTTVCGILIILLAIIFRPLPAVAETKNVDDWLEENSNILDGNMDETEDKEKREEDTTTPSNGNDPQSEQVNDSSGSLFVVIVKMIFALLLVLGLIYVLLQFLKKKNKLFMKSNALENIGGITVGSNKSMQIVRIGSRFFVIGVGENVEILHEITDQEIVQDFLDKEENDEKSTSRLLASFTAKNKVGQNQNEERNFKQLFSRELLNLKQSRKKIMNENKEDTHE